MLKKYIVITHIIIIAAILGSSEPFNSIEYSPWIMIVSLSLFLIYYIISCIIKLTYVSKFDILITLFVLIFWVAALFTAEYWTNITGWDGLVYLIYPFIAGIFFICLLVINLLVFVIKRVKKDQ
ncbi:MAG: hypothetical protein LBD23_08215 [Oscillospiraceae bacterium]|jgi:hypothetical protein|nr:hypothetical protein [Oscillospiraceae bacterium]